MKSFKDFIKENKVDPLHYKIHNQAGGVAVIDIQGYIGRDIIMEWITGEESPNTVEKLKDKLRSISEQKIIVNINSPGGDLNDGLVIRDILMSKKAEVVTNVQGFSASAATVIGQAGTTRRMPKNTSFQLLHRAMFGLMGFYNQNTLRSIVRDQVVIDRALIRMYASQSNGKSSEKEIGDLMDEGEGYGRWMDAEEALEMGLIDEIYDPADTDDPNTDHLESQEEIENRKQATQNLLQLPPMNVDSELIGKLLGEEDAKKFNIGEQKMILKVDASEIEKLFQEYGFEKRNSADAQRMRERRIAARKREIDIIKTKGSTP